MTIGDAPAAAGRAADMSAQLLTVFGREGEISHDDRDF